MRLLHNTRSSELCSECNTSICIQHWQQSQYPDLQILFPHSLEMVTIFIRLQQLFSLMLGKVRPDFSILCTDFILTAGRKA